MERELISVIVPIYNAAEYLEKCIRSICEQTYDKLEIILVNDGSTDESGSICRKLRGGQKRIVYIEQSNQGQGIARNKALAIAKGTYVVFVDADDWIIPEGIEILYNKIKAENADICLSTTFFNYDEKTSKSLSVLCEPSRDINDISSYKFPGLCWKMFKKDLFIDNKILMPHIPYEDTAIYPVLMFKAKKICYNEIPMYYYRINTGKSTTDNPQNIIKFTETLDYLIRLLRQHNLYQEHRELVAELAISFMGTLLGRASREMETESYHQIKNNYYSFISKEFPEYAQMFEEKRFWILGSYNLSRIVANVSALSTYSLIGKDLEFYYGFSNTISLMSPGKAELNVEHGNKFRNDVLQKDISKKFLDIEVNQNDYICIDFLEDCYNVLECGDTFITESEVLQETGISYEKNMRRITCGSDEYEELWEKACVKLSEYLRKRFKQDHIFLFRNYLTPYKSFEGNSIKWDNSEANFRLKRRYDFLLKQLPGIHVMDTPEEVNFTDGNSKYGAAPDYLNYMAHQKLAKRVRSIVFKDCKLPNGGRKEKVTIAIPVYNGSNYLAEAIDCALMQTYPNIEVIVVNDGSNDNGETEKIALSYGDKIRYLKKENGGVASALNMAAESMEGEYFSWLSHDDLYDIDKVEKQMKVIHDSGNKDTIIYGNYVIWDISRGVTYDTKMESRYSYEELTKGLYPVFMGLVNGCTTLFHKNHFNRVGMFDEKLKTTQDYDFWFRLFRNQKVSFIIDNLVTERCHDAQGSRTLSGYEGERNQLYFNFMNNLSKEEVETLFGSEYSFYLKMIPKFKEWDLPLCIEEAIKRFMETEEPEEHRNKLEGLQSYIDGLFDNRGGSIYVFGAGRIGRRLVSQLQLRDFKVDGIIDNSAEKQGKYIENLVCYKLNDIGKEERIIVAVKENKSILQQLQQEGYRNITDKYLDILKYLEQTPVARQFFLKENKII